MAPRSHGSLPSNALSYLEMNKRLRRSHSAVLIILSLVSQPFSAALGALREIQLLAHHSESIPSHFTTQALSNIALGSLQTLLRPKLKREINSHRRPINFSPLLAPSTLSTSRDLVRTMHLPIALWRPFKQRLISLWSGENIPSEVIQRIISLGHGVSRVNEQGDIEIEELALPYLLPIINEYRRNHGYFPIDLDTLRNELARHEEFHQQLRGHPLFINYLTNLLQDPRLYTNLPYANLSELQSVFVKNYGRRYENMDLFVEELWVLVQAGRKLLGHGIRLEVDWTGSPETQTIQLAPRLIRLLARETPTSASGSSILRLWTLPVEIVSAITREVAANDESQPNEVSQISWMLSHSVFGTETPVSQELPSNIAFYIGKALAQLFPEDDPAKYSSDKIQIYMTAVQDLVHRLSRYPIHTSEFLWHLKQHPDFSKWKSYFATTYGNRFSDDRTFAEELWIVYHTESILTGRAPRWSATAGAPYQSRTIFPEEIASIANQVRLSVARVVPTLEKTNFEMRATRLLTNNGDTNRNTYEGLLKDAFSGATEPTSIRALIGQTISRKGRSVWVDVGPAYGFPLIQGKFTFQDSLTTYGVDLVNWLQDHSSRFPDQIQPYFARIGPGAADPKYGFTHIPAFIDHAELPEKADLITTFNSLYFAEDPLQALVHLFNQLEHRGTLIGNLPLHRLTLVRNGKKQNLMEEIKVSLRAHQIDATVTDEGFFIIQRNIRSVLRISASRSVSNGHITYASPKGPERLIDAEIFAMDQVVPIRLRIQRFVSRLEQIFQSRTTAARRLLLQAV